jgi:glycosyltransferase involved in cell wall biosynthesis
MANGIPVIVSESHLFDDLDGVLPRPSGPVELAQAIDKMFSDAQHRTKVLQQSQAFLHQNTWPMSAKRYLDVYSQISKD